MPRELLPRSLFFVRQLAVLTFTHPGFLPER